jgi:hypothetical protein
MGKHTATPREYVYKKDGFYYKIDWKDGCSTTPEGAVTHWTNPQGIIQPIKEEYYSVTVTTFSGQTEEEIAKKMKDYLKHSKHNQM